jgi:hypothetical protein
MNVRPQDRRLEHEAGEKHNQKHMHAAVMPHDVP